MVDIQDRWQQAQVAYAKKIRTAAYNSAYVAPGYDVEDMEQELLVVLWESCAMYDPDKGATFNSFFWMRAKQRISAIKKRANAQKRRAEVVYLEDVPLADLIDKVLSAEEECLLYEQVRQRRGGHIVAAQWEKTLVG